MARLTSLLVAGALVLGVVAVGGAPAAAASIAVTTTADSGSGSLRAAVAEANASDGPDVIVLAAGAEYTLTNCGAGQLVSTGGPLTIEGHGATIRQTCPSARVIENGGDGLLALHDVTLTGGDAPTHGGAVLSTAGPVSLVGVTVAGNRAAAYGGGVYHDADSALSVVRSTIRGNSAFDYGGGIAVYGELLLEGSTVAENTVTADDAYGGGIYVHPSSPGTVRIEDSTVHANQAGGVAALGGGIYVDADGVEITTTTVSDNVAGADGGGIYAYYDTTLSRSTVTGNRAGSRGGGVLAFGNHVEIESSTVVGNSAAAAGGGIAGEGLPVVATYVTIDGNEAPTGANVDMGGGELAAFGTVVAGPVGGQSCHAVVAASRGHNHEVGSDTCGFVAPTDVRAGADARLGPLADNGGPTRTQLPADDSPLVGAIPAADPGCTGADQRGVTRPQRGACDIGAVQLSAPGTVPPGPVVVPRFTG